MNKPFIIVDGRPCVISAHYVTTGGGWTATRFLAEYVDLRELNKDMPKFIAELPSPHWTIAIGFQDYVGEEE